MPASRPRPMRPSVEPVRSERPQPATGAGRAGAGTGAVSASIRCTRGAASAQAPVSSAVVSTTSKHARMAPSTEAKTSLIRPESVGASAICTVDSSAGAARSAGSIWWVRKQPSTSPSSSCSSRTLPAQALTR